MRIRSFFILPFLAALGCGSEPSGPSADDVRPADGLNFLRHAPDAPPLASTTASFYAKRGEDRELRMYYQPAPGSGEPGEQFLRFRVNAGSLARRPDGTEFTAGDSVLITLTVVDPERLIVDFQPAGLRFAENSPAELKIEYAETDDDINDDGVVDASDDELERSLSIWRQERAGEPWFRMASVVLEDLDEVEADIFGFTHYVVAY